MSQSPINDRRLCLVSGYHAVSYPPDAAYEAGLRFRFAVVFDTAPHDTVDMYFDSNLFLQLLPSVCEAIGFNTIDIRMNDGQHLSSFGALGRLYATLNEGDREPPSWMELRCGDELSGIVEAELWKNVGGPPPYHDSYTMSCYTRLDQSAELRRVCEGICSEAAACVTGFYSEPPTKEPYSYLPWWRRALDWLASR